VVIFRQVLPTRAAPIIVSRPSASGNVLLLEAGLSFLRHGVRPPAPSWGNIIGDGAPTSHRAWTTLFPGLAIALVVMDLNAVGRTRCATPSTRARRRGDGTAAPRARP